MQTVATLVEAGVATVCIVPASMRRVRHGDVRHVPLVNFAYRHSTLMVWDAGRASAATQAFVAFVMARVTPPPATGADG